MVIGKAGFYSVKVIMCITTLSFYFLCHNQVADTNIAELNEDGISITSKSLGTTQVLKQELRLFVIILNFFL